ncbi:Lrp/AsnC family transcriptional regulator [Microbacterium sp. NPDC058342]|uniref:Lrp/AsnC family transcriptional regulator n=1 Tax=Microbacterium sp. NPDC058342 TaxID=3346454 RepID=UPI003649FCB2
MDPKPTDRIDEKILAELSRNSRMSHAEIGQRVSLSRNAVRQRIERLERDGHIRSYTIVRGRSTAQGSTVSAILHVYRQDRMRGVDVLGELQLIPEVVSCDVLSGDFDLLVRVEARSIDRVREIWEHIAALPGVRDTVTALTLASVISRPTA